MDVTSLNQLADAIGPLLATGAAGRVGSLGTEHAIDGTQRLAYRIFRSRQDRGLPEAPASRDELLDELRRLLSSADDAKTVQIAHKQIIQNFHGPVDARGARFGF